MALVALLFAAALVTVMNWSQDDLIFPVHAVGPADPLPPGSERLVVKTRSGETLHGVHVPPRRNRSGTLVVGFGGNAWNGDNVAGYLHELYPNADVVAFHYRGYRPSTGKPSAQAILADAPRVLKAAIERVKPERVVVVGFSIGSGVAASLAADPRVAGVILVTPFDSMKAVAGDLYPWLPVGLLFRHEIDSASFVLDSGKPVAIVAAERDEIIPPRRTEALRKAVVKLVLDRTIGRAGHNDIYARSDFHAAMREALEAVSSS